ncbi:tyrosine-type recombinase/integrase [Sporosarcina highlanderae]|uniref:Site-specific integrase n=1 Tax=Sporosarcina highlanderae TaxID=3035916 RepID=A0ABT8JS21_9BACL|nr:site-specific integrase [Sporosarcina highlanderae]MDN4607956.1 site-specific integrase [Sporosarcina highlanderae]
MKNLLTEINLFLNSSNYAESTKQKYKNKLLGFARKLEEMTNTDLEAIHLYKLYEVYDKNDNFICHRPLDKYLVDQFFQSFIPCSFSVLKDNKDAIAAFFLYLYRVYSFPNLMEKIDFNLNDYRPKNIKVNILSKHHLLKFFQKVVFNSDNTERDLLLFILFITTGCRSSEITRIKIKDIIWDDHVLFIPWSKGNKSKVIPLREGMTSALKRYCLKYRLESNDSLFELTSTEMRDLFKMYLELAKLPKVTLHSMRNSFATFMLDSGAAITEIQQLLGHEDLNTTKGYINTSYTRNKNISIKENKDLYKSVNSWL